MKLPHLRWPWRCREAACVLDGDALAAAPDRIVRRPLAWLLGRASLPAHGVAVILDHEHAGAMLALQAVQQRCREHVDAGAIVFGVENLPPQRDMALFPYRCLARAPVLGVDLRLPTESLVLAVALGTARAVSRLDMRVGATPSSY